MDHSIFFVVDLDELSKPTGIIIVNCFGISKGLQKIKSQNMRGVSPLWNMIEQMLDKFSILIMDALWKSLPKICVQIHIN